MRWGIMGTGTIATDFVRVLAAMPDAAVAAVGSRSAERAAAFAAELGVPTATTHGSYEELVADPQVDVIYIATPSSRHVSDSILCLQAGKPVLCEKSMAPTAEEADRVLKLARQRGIFFLHGVWSRFFPAMRAIREAIASGAIGTVYSAHASFCQVARAPLPSILCNGSITVRRPSMYMSHVPGARRSLVDRRFDLMLAGGRSRVLLSHGGDGHLLHSVPLLGVWRRCRGGRCIL